MKNKKTLILLIISVLFSCSLLFACNNTQYAVTFNSMGGSWVGSAVTDGKSQITLSVPAKSGYEFGGWFYDKDVWERPFGADSLISSPIKDNLTVYAKWNAAAAANVHAIMLPSGTGYTATAAEGCGMTVPSGGSFSFTVTLDAGYDRSSITVKANDRTLKSADNRYTISGITRSQTVSVTGITANSYTVSFDCDGGTAGAVSPRTVAFMDVYGALPDAGAKLGYRFGGWFTQAKGGGTQITDLSIMTEPSNQRLYAKWIPQNSAEGALTYKLINGGAEYSVGAGAGAGAEEYVIIPAMHNGLPVAVVAENGFNASSVRNIIFADESNIRSIGDSAFKDCGNLESIAFPDSLISMGRDSFRNCAKLAGVVFPRNLAAIGADAFYGCTGLVNAEFKRAVNAAGEGVMLGNENVFRDCINLTYIFVPDHNSVAGYKAKAAWRQPSDIKTRIVTRSDNTYIVTFDLKGGNIDGNPAPAVRMTPPGGGIIEWPEPVRNGRILVGWNVGGMDIYLSANNTWQEISFVSDITINIIW